MTHRRNILTVDGFQVAIIDRRGIVWNHQKQKLKHEFSKEMNIGYNGIGCIYQIPERGLKTWQPEKK